MNWIDIILLAVLVIGLLWGLKTGILMAASVAIGGFIGLSIAGNLAPLVGDLVGFTFFADSLITVVAYWVIVAATIFAAVKIVGILRPLLAIATLGTASLADRLGGLALGLLVGLFLMTAIIVGLARVAFDFDYPSVSLPGTSATVDAGGVPQLENQRQSLVDSLTASRVVPIFLKVWDFVPASLFGLAPVDFNAALTLLDQQIDG